MQRGLIILSADTYTCLINSEISSAHYAPNMDTFGVTP